MCNTWKQRGKWSSKSEICGQEFDFSFNWNSWTRISKTYVFLVAYKSIKTQIRVHVTDLTYFKFFISIDSFI